MTMNIETITVGFTGASGLQYGIRLLQCLLQANKKVYLVMSQAAQVVAAMETELNLPAQPENLQTFLEKKFSVTNKQLKVFGHQQWAAPIASGSNAADAMVICPASSGCISAIANGSSNNLLERAADVMIKEKKPLIVVPREAPYSEIHLENMLKLARMNVSIIPASPGFYHKPKTIDDLIDFIVARILDQLKIEHQLLPRWGE